jgi:murein L,D-transpeptidase YafK
MTHYEAVKILIEFRSRGECLLNFFRGIISFALLLGPVLAVAQTSGSSAASGSDDLSPTMQQALAAADAQPGNPIYIQVLKLTQEEFNQHSSPTDPAIHEDLYNPHPSAMPAEPADMTFYKHASDFTDNGYTQWEDDHGQINKAGINLGQIEVWIRNSKGVYVNLSKYMKIPLTVYGGPLGPKTRKGDFQTPEGFYKINALKPGEYVDALGLNYPNTYDRAHVRAGVTDLGGSILIHGAVGRDDRTVGCIGAGDNVKDIYALAAAAKRNGQSEISVAILPFPLTNENLSKIPDAAPGAFDFKEFWKKMQPGYLPPDQPTLPPTISFNPSGDYVVSSHLPETAPYDILKEGFGNTPSADCHPKQ